MSFVLALVDQPSYASPGLSLLSDLSYYFCLVGILAIITIQYRRHVASKQISNQTSYVEKGLNLFPSIDDTSCFEKQPFNDNGLPENHQNKCELGPQPCSTGLTTRLLPFKNAKGEIEWVFSDDIVPGNELDAFKVTSMPLRANVKEESTIDLSPVTSLSSNSEFLSTKKLDLSVLQFHTPSSSSSEDHRNDDQDLDDEEEEGGDQNYQCPHCSSNFKMRGYLTRHLKKHSTQKAYKCPFHNSTVLKTDLDGLYKCHPTGGFSRRDTYKTHLKSRHFRYPRGTSTRERNLSRGSCGLCGELFQNAEIWTEIHIEGAECKFLPPGFKGKSRIKNRMKKQMARLMKEQKLQMVKRPGSINAQHPEYQSPVFATPNSIIAPMFGSSANDCSDSPTRSVSSVGPSTAQYTGTPQIPELHNVKPHALSNTVNCMNEAVCTGGYEDYDDDYCLDTEQISFPAMLARNNGMMLHPDALYSNGVLTKMNRIMSQYSH